MRGGACSAQAPDPVLTDDAANARALSERAAALRTNLDVFLEIDTAAVEVARPDGSRVARGGRDRARLAAMRWLGV
jgi:D-serine deaminase-like pyridoxal phosphate-dependent protein